MGEEYEGAAGICGENWWTMDSTRTLFPPPPPPPPPPRGTWAGGSVDMKASRSSCGQENSNSTHELDAAPPTILLDSTLQIMGFGLPCSSSTSSTWDHSLFRRYEREESNLEAMVEEETSIQKNLSPIMTSIYDDDPQTQEQEHRHSSVFNNRTISMSYSNEASIPTWSCNNNNNNKNDNSKVVMSSSFLKPPTCSWMHKHPNTGLHFSNNTPFWNASADSLNDMRAGPPPNFASSLSQFKITSTPPTSTFLQHKPTTPSPPTLLFNKIKSEESMESTSVAKRSTSVGEGALKRARIETPSPLPTFKVRKEKLGDRVTALQQLVSPFGKTDTASVLHEAIEYIKFLHEQVNVLSTPYMKSGAPIQRHQGCDETKESEGEKQDLRSRGLCLVPISSTFPVAATESSAHDFWTPTLSFGGALLK